MAPHSPPDPAAQAARLADEVAEVRATEARLAAQVGDQGEAGRLLGLVSAGPGAESFLPVTIPALCEQARAAGRWADLLIGLNGGFRCDALVRHWESLPDTVVVRLYTGPKPSPVEPSPIRATPEPGPPFRLSGAPAHHRLIVVHQAAGEHSAGKIRMLNDLVLGLVLPSIAAGWRPPAHTLLFDAESLFFTRDEPPPLSVELSKVTLLLQRANQEMGRVVNVLLQVAGKGGSAPAAGIDAPPTLAGAGLARLLAALDEDLTLAIVGATTHFTAYEQVERVAGLPVRRPTPAMPTSPLHRFYNLTCGEIEGCHCMPGGGTLGRTLIILSLLATIAARYPGTTSEDAILTVLAQAAGHTMAMHGGVLMTNRCPPLADEAAWQQQFIRWYAGFDAVERLYGRDAARAVLGPDNDLFLRATLALFLRHLQRSGDEGASLRLLHDFVSSGERYRTIRAAALARPDDPDRAGRPAWATFDDGTTAERNEP